MSKAPRGKSFTTSELESLLEIIEDILPVGPNDWEAVLARHELDILIWSAPSKASNVSFLIYKATQLVPQQ